MTENRKILICDQTLFRKIFWPGGMYYIDFQKDKVEILIWFFDNLNSFNYTIVTQQFYNDNIEVQDRFRGAYRVSFRRKIDFIAFKLTWL